jgi:LPXTG-motif cell wall-anchored protein
LYGRYHGYQFPEIGGHLLRYCHYPLLPGHDFIILYLGFGTEDTPETISWANEVLRKHADRNAILGMHAYLEYDATLSNMSQNVFDKIIVPNENVKMVIGGHYHGVTKRISKIQNQDGSTREVLEMLADYQGGPNGGDGYVRLLTFDPIAGKVDIKTYSPLLDDYDFFAPEDESFTESFTFNDINKRVATDYFSVNIYSNKTIGSDENVPSGEFATTKWKNKQPNQTYYWYMNITDEYGATRKSDIYRFTTGDTVPPENQDGEEDTDNEDDTSNEDDHDNEESDDQVGEDNGNNGGGDHQSPETDNHDNDHTNSNNDQMNQENAKDSSSPSENNTYNSNQILTHGAQKNQLSLPNTATNSYTFLLIGTILLIVGLAIHLTRRRLKM